MKLSPILSSLYVDLLWVHERIDCQVGAFLQPFPWTEIYYRVDSRLFWKHSKNSDVLEPILHGKNWICGLNPNPELDYTGKLGWEMYSESTCVCVDDFKVKLILFNPLVSSHSQKHTDFWQALMWFITFYQIFISPDVFWFWFTTCLCTCVATWIWEGIKSTLCVVGTDEYLGYLKAYTFL